MACRAAWCCRTPYHAPCPAAQALADAKANDLMFWASRYHIFVHWSGNKSHPWDKAPKAEGTCATLEIGKLRDSDNEVRACCRVHHRIPAWLPPLCISAMDCLHGRCAGLQHGDLLQMGREAGWSACATHANAKQPAQGEHAVHACACLIRPWCCWTASPSLTHCMHARA